MTPICTLFRTKIKAISLLVSALLLTIIVLAGFALLYTIWQSYASRVAETQKQEIIKAQKELSWFAGIEYSYILNNSNTCTLHLWYYCTPINCSLVTFYLDSLQLTVSPKNISLSIIDNLYLYNLTTNLATCPSQSAVSIKLVIAFSEPGSPYYITKEITYLAPVVTG